MNNSERMSLLKYKVSAVLGIILMGISCYIACFGEAVSTRTEGNILLLISIIIMGVGFSRWQP